MKLGPRLQALADFVANAQQTQFPHGTTVTSAWTEDDFHYLHAHQVDHEFFIYGPTNRSWLLCLSSWDEVIPVHAQKFKDNPALAHLFPKPPGVPMRHEKTVHEFSFSCQAPDSGSDFVDRLTDALSLLCGGEKPPRDFVDDWLANRDESLQDWVLDNSVLAWAQGIVLIEAAVMIASMPAEGRGHKPCTR